MVENKVNKVTIRSVIIGLLLMPINYYWLVKMEVIDSRLWSTSASLFFTSVFSLFVIIILNYPISKISPKLSLKPTELVVIYAIFNISSAVGGQGMIMVLIGGLGYAFQFATPENEWQDMFHQYLPRWLVVDNIKALDNAYEGESSFYISEHIQVWIKPVLWWSLFLFALVFAMLCINIIIRKHWIEKERLSYPIIQLPLEMIKSPTLSGFFQNKLMWVGFGIAVFISLINGFHFLSPRIPGLQNVYDITYVFSEKPWSSMATDGIFIAFYPCAVGLAFLMPLDMAFSVWFFYFFWLAELFIGGIMGLRSMPEFPYPKYQASGACISIGILSLWISRSQLADVFRHLIGKGNIDDKNEPIRYRSATLGLAISLLILILFSMRMGIALWVAMLFIFLYLMTSIAVTRMRAELGPFYHEFYYGGAEQVITALFGTKRVGAMSLTGLSLFWGITRAQSSHPMPHQLESFKLAEKTDLSNKGMYVVLILAMGLGIITSFWILLDVFYRKGMTGCTYFGYEIFTRLENWLQRLASPDYVASGFMGFGSIFTFFLMFMRRRFIWWQFHPLGYVVTQGDWGIKFLWFSVFISYIIKHRLLSYGGVKAYRRALPIFMGLILGDFVAGSVWQIIGWIAGIPTYSFKNW
ncbi:TPA: hypothetical protein ENS27_12410 [bacterium]|nr:hypothetical protein [bacterium]